MTHFRIRKGLDVPLAGAPQQVVHDGARISTVAVLGPDTIGLRPVLAVAEGERVKLGQTLFSDRQNPRVCFTSPAAGVVEKIYRGERRALQSVVVRIDGNEAETFDLADARTRPGLQQVLLKSGLWTALRTRPFSKIPQPDTEAASIFVTAIDTNPHAPDPAVVIATEPQAFQRGLAALALLASKVHVCTARDSRIEVPQQQPFHHAEFSGPHPAGLVGTHIHLLDPVSEKRVAWHLGYQDVMAIGRLLASGTLDPLRIVSIAGPLVRNPRLVRTRLGANINELLSGEMQASKKRLLSGSVLGGRRASGALAWLGRYHNQVSVLAEGSEREFLAWARPGMHRYSALRAFGSHLLHKGDYPLTTSQNGSPRAMVSTGSFEKVMPLDILPTPLLKALLVEDTDTARDLGCLELDEEDLALCSFVCNGKYEYGPYLRQNLELIEANG